MANSGSSSFIHTRKFSVKPALLDVLKVAGAKNDRFSIKEILDHLQSYIYNRTLYDVKDPSKIYCENDLLGKAFGVSRFTVNDVSKLVSANLYLLSPSEKGDGQSRERVLASSAASVPEKRKSEENEDVPSPKRQCSEGSSVGKSTRSPIYIDIYDSPAYDSSPETEWSVQGYETAIVKDSSDDLWYLETEEEYEVQLATERFEVEVNEDGDQEFVEYEVASVSSSQHEEFSDTESEVADVVSAALLLSQNDSDVEFWADSSDNEEFSSSDSEITDGDKWNCKHCSAFNRPLLRFCQKCWQLRDDWLPERRRPKRRRIRPKRKRAGLLRRTVSVPYGGTEEGIRNVRCRRTSLSLPDVSIATDLNPGETSSERTTPLLSPDSSDEKESSSQETLPGTSKNSDDNAGAQSSVPSLCTICLARPKTASIIHGKTGHQICCYSCGKKLWERNKPCPACRRPIQKVITNFIL